MTEELTQQDKARLLAVTDGKATRDEEYDREFYETMYRIRSLQMDEVDEGVRRAILRFVMDGKGEASKPENGGFVMMGFVHGYLVGQGLRRDIRRKERLEGDSQCQE